LSYGGEGLKLRPEAIAGGSQRQKDDASVAAENWGKKFERERLLILEADTLLSTKKKNKGEER